MQIVGLGIRSLPGLKGETMAPGMAGKKHRDPGQLPTRQVQIIRMHTTWTHLISFASAFSLTLNRYQIKRFMKISGETKIRAALNTVGA
jgi:hypothetical protein